MAAPDLSFARETFAGLMPDRCTVTRNPGGVEDDALDQNTMQLTPAGVEPWYDGPCLLKLDGEDDQEGTGTVKLPFTLDVDPDKQLQRGDAVTCYASENGLLIGRTWTVDNPVGGSFSVSRKATISESRV